MHIAELWRYPVKSLRGELIQSAEVLETGIRGDREIVVISAERKRVITSRTHHRLLGLQGGISPVDGEATINGIPWQEPAARNLVEQAAGEPVELHHIAGAERFDVLPLLVATDGAIASIGLDRRRFRPNILIGGVKGLAERQWEGKRLRLGAVEIHVAQLRARCVMTTYDPDTLEQDKSVLFRIVSDYDGTMALDCSVTAPGVANVGDEVIVSDCLQARAQIQPPRRAASLFRKATTESRYRPIRSRLPLPALRRVPIRATRACRCCPAPGSASRNEWYPSRCVDSCRSRRWNPAPAARHPSRCAPAMGP